MENTPNSRKSFEQGQGKDSRFSSQEKTIFRYLSHNTATNSMVSDATGIARPSICRAKRNFEKAGTLQEVECKLCKITGFKAYYLTTNRELFNKE
jgi:GTP-sensing pleiotropic transcriptional regulator CodY